MARTVDLAHREELLDRIAAYVVEHGVADLSLRPMGDALGVSPRTLLYHFGSKDEMVVAAFRHLRAGQMALVERFKSAEFASPEVMCKFAWDYMTAPEFLPRMTLFFETYALALRDPKRFPGFLDAAVEDWLSLFAGPLRAAGIHASRARTLATITLAGYRGFMLDLAATGDRDRVGDAVDLWVDALRSLYSDGDTNAQQA